MYGEQEWNPEGKRPSDWVSSRLRFPTRFSALTLVCRCVFAKLIVWYDCIKESFVNVKELLF